MIIAGIISGQMIWWSLCLTLLGVRHLGNELKVLRPVAYSLTGVDSLSS